jgi:hypothetical protein
MERAIYWVDPARGAGLTRPITPLPARDAVRSTPPARTGRTRTSDGGR